MRESKRVRRRMAIPARLLPSFMTSPYLPPKPGTRKVRKISVRLDAEIADDLHRLAVIWNKASGEAYTGASLAELFLRNGVEEAWRYAGGRPDAPPKVTVGRKSAKVAWTPETLARHLRAIEIERNKRPSND